MGHDTSHRTNRRTKHLQAAGDPHQLPELVEAAASEDWCGPATDTLMAEFEFRLIDWLPSRLVSGLGVEEARQTARIIAWEGVRRWLDDPRTDLRRLGWGYLANLVRWRVADALDKETLRSSRHVPTDKVPEDTPYVVPVDDPAEGDLDCELGTYLDALVVELVRLGMDRAAAVRALHVACDDTDLRRSRVVDRLSKHAGIDEEAAEALADLLVGNAQRRVVPVVRRLVEHEPRQQIVTDPKVGSRLERIAAAAPAAGPMGLAG
jgi:hypothetical protein